MKSPAARVGTLGSVGRGVVVAAASLAMAVFRYRAWDRSFSVPLATAGTDHLYIASVLRSIHDTGWYFTNPHLGAPFGQQLYDFPQTGESIQLLVLRFLTLFSDRPFWVMNVYFLAGFGLVAFVTYLVLAHLRFSFGVAAVVSILYTWLPYHFMHGEFHLFRSAYLSAPLGVLLIFWVLSWKDRFLVDPAGPVWGWRRMRANLRWGRVWGAVGVCVFIGAFETMVMAFVLVALVVGAGVSALRNRDVGDLGVAVAAGALIAATFAVLFIPNLVYKVDHGPNTAAAARIPAEQITYGLQISKMVLPSGSHPVEALANLLPRSLHRSPVTSEPGQTLGLLGALGLLGLLYGVIVNRLDTRAGREVFDRQRLWVQSGLISLVLILFGTMGGFALVLSTLGLSQIRVWNRVVILIAFCAYLVVAMALEWVAAWVRRRVAAWGRSDGDRSDRARSRARRSDGRVVTSGAVAVLLVGVMAFGLWDTQSPYSSGARNAAYDRQATEMKHLDGAIASRIGEGAAIFQLPVVPFPEVPTLHRMRDYEEFLPYLYSEDLDFSYGATRGRPDADWQRKVDNADPVASLAALRGLGFDAVLVDTFGYADRGVAVTRDLTKALGEPVVTSRSGRWVLWDLRGLAARKNLTSSELRDAARRLVGPDLMRRAARTN